MCLRGASLNLLASCRSYRSSSSLTGLNGMVEFELQLLTDPRLFGLIAAHGCVDFARPDLLAVYTLAAVPLGSVPTTLGFLSSSLIHFGRDLGVALSVVLHALAGLVYLKDPNVAFSLMMACRSFSTSPRSM